jgi:arginine N-succinyltransferase
MDDSRNSPFWDALAGKFFDMTFPEADEFNAVHGTKFITDLMPRTPIYVVLLSDAAKAVIGQPHPSGRPALRMLEQEGFYFERYVDIFDGGPTVTANTNDIATIRESTEQRIAAIEPGGSTKMLVAHGRLKDFAACFATVRDVGEEGIAIDPEAAGLLGVEVGDTIVTVRR